MAVSNSWTDDTGTFTLTVTNVADDHGGDAASATRISTGETLLGVLQLADDTDYFRLQADEGQLYKVHFNSDSLPWPLFDSYIRIYDSEGLSLEFTEISGTSQTVWEAPNSGNYYIAVADPFGGSTGRYSLTVAPFDIPDITDDHGDTWETATELVGSGSVEGGPDYEGDIDFFCFRSEPRIYFDNAKVAYKTLSDAEITLYDSEGTEQPEGNNQYTGAYDVEAISVSPRVASKTGAYCAAVYSPRYDTGTYNVTVEYCRTADAGCVP